MLKSASIEVENAKTVYTHVHINYVLFTTYKNYNEAYGQFKRPQHIHVVI